MSLLLNTTSTALWYQIIHDAEECCSVNLKDEVESYLVFLLMRYTNQPQIAKQIIALDFLEGVNKSAPAKKQLIMQEVGDKCLLFAGLFPALAEKKRVKISYFVNIGRSAYSAISKRRTDLYGLLEGHFVPMMDILQSIKRYSQKYPDLLPLQAYDLWNETGSQRALEVLKQYTHGIPIIPIKK